MRTARSLGRQKLRETFPNGSEVKRIFHSLRARQSIEQGTCWQPCRRPCISQKLKPWLSLRLQSRDASRLSQTSILYSLSRAGPVPNCTTWSTKNLHPTAKGTE